MVDGGGGYPHSCHDHGHDHHNYHENHHTPPVDETEIQAGHDSGWREERGLAMILNQVPVWK